jgi:hypothetical protein
MNAERLQQCHAVHAGRHHDRIRREGAVVDMEAQAVAILLDAFHCAVEMEFRPELLCDVLQVPAEKRAIARFVGRQMQRGCQRRVHTKRGLNRTRRIGVDQAVLYAGLGQQLHRGAGGVYILWRAE